MFSRFPRETDNLVTKRRWMFETLESRIAMHGGAADEFDVLIFSHTASFRHSAIPTGIETIQEIGLANGFHTEATEDPTVFNDASLTEFEAVVFLNTTGDVLNPEQQAAFERYIQGGGGYVGVHAASDTEHQWPWYGELVGAYFAGHPPIQTATIEFVDRVHPSTRDLPERWSVRDEWYNYNINPRGSVHVLATLDESTFEGSTMGFDHPITWAHDFDGGRAWYTGLGHLPQVYDTVEMQRHLLGGIEYAAGRAEADVGATLDGNFRKVVLEANTDDPMQMDIASDGRVFFAERGGDVQVYDPSTDRTRTVGHIEVTEQFEDGLLGLALDPQFDTNGFVYLFYSPPDADENRVARFSIEDNQLINDSERILIRIPIPQRTYHSGGSLEFGPEGLLYIGVGDNTNPFASDGYAPIDERPNRALWDAQRSAGNAEDLRGKILRVRPEPDGSYSIPEGNLFPPDGSAGRPEIFVMGSRNPFRMSIDPDTGWLYWGDVGPDSESDDALRGPAGADELNQARAAGNFGWPYFVGDNTPYVDYDFQTQQSGNPFDATTPVNDSPNNTGPERLPAAQPALIWYEKEVNDAFPELGRGSRTAMAGPVYQFNADSESTVKLPEYFDNTLFIYEWSRRWVKEVKLDSAGNVLAINPILSSFNFERTIDMEFGPDGAIYMLEWGIGFGGGNEDSELIRIEYTGAPSNQLTAIAEVDVDNGAVPLTVNFSASQSANDSEGALTFAWDFDDDGVTDSTDENATFTYERPGDFVARLTVTDHTDRSHSTTTTISAGNTAPVVEIVSPPNGAFFEWGSPVEFRARVSDAEDGSSDAGDIHENAFIVQPLLGHDLHAHPGEILNEFAGSFVAPEVGHGDAAADLYLVLEARYEDQGGEAVGSLEGQARHILNPRRMQAEHFSSAVGVTATAPQTGTPEGDVLSSIRDGGFFSFDPVYLGDVGEITYRLRSPVGGGRIELRLDDPAGDMLVVHPIDVNADGYVDFRGEVPNLRESHELFFVFHGTEDQLAQLSIDWLEFAAAEETRSLPGDANQDGEVNFGDFLILSRNFGSNDAVRADGDFDGDRDIDFEDFLTLAANFGRVLDELNVVAPVRAAVDDMLRVDKAADLTIMALSSSEDAALMTDLE